jgi:hypothetical protein
VRAFHRSWIGSPNSRADLSLSALFHGPILEKGRRDIGLANAAVRFRLGL